MVEVEPGEHQIYPEGTTSTQSLVGNNNAQPPIDYDPSLGQRARLVAKAGITAFAITLGVGEFRSVAAGQSGMSRTEFIDELRYAAKSNSERACKRRTNYPETCSTINLSNCTVGPKAAKSLSKGEGSCRSSFRILGGSYTRRCTNQRLIYKFEQVTVQDDGGTGIYYDPVLSGKSASWKCQPRKR
jgi:hypothetical protein